MPEYRVVLVGPKYEGNVGATARVLANFDVKDLVLVDPPALGDEARQRAMHAWDIVGGARTATSFADAVRGCDLVVGSSAKIPASEKSHVRNPVALRDLPGKLAPMAGTVALCFGREDFGLFNEEIAQCDILLTIPTSPAYKSLNLSHAVAVVLYELYASRPSGPVKVLTPMSEEMRRTFQETFDRLVDQIGLPEHKVRNTKQVARRIFGRAVPSAWEFYVLMGVLSRILHKYGVDVESARWDAPFELPADAATDIEAVLAAMEPGPDA